jgi:hypothetical protein
VKSVRLRWTGLIQEKYRPYGIWLGKHLGKCPLGTPTWLSNYNIRMDVRRKAVIEEGKWK